jgi:hypothetical protein
MRGIRMPWLQGGAWGLPRRMGDAGQKNAMATGGAWGLPRGMGDAGHKNAMATGWCMGSALSRVEGAVEES